MTETETNPSLLHRKIAEVMSAVGFVAKDKKNTAQKYDYVSDTALVMAVRDELANRKLTIVPRVVAESIQVTQRPGKSDFITTAAIEYTITCGDTGESITACVLGQGFDSLDKGGYKAMTGALKYVLRQTFLIPTGDDAEAPVTIDADEPTDGQRDVAKRMLKSLGLEGDERDLLLGKHGIQHGVPATKGAMDALIAELFEMAEARNA